MFLLLVAMYISTVLVSLQYKFHWGTPKGGDIEPVMAFVMSFAEIWEVPS